MQSAARPYILSTASCSARGQALSWCHPRPDVHPCSYASTFMHSQLYKMQQLLLINQKSGKQEVSISATSTTSTAVACAATMAPPTSHLANNTCRKCEQLRLKRKSNMRDASRQPWKPMCMIYRALLPAVTYCTGKPIKHIPQVIRARLLPLGVSLRRARSEMAPSYSLFQHNTWASSMICCSLSSGLLCRTIHVSVQHFEHCFSLG